VLAKSAHITSFLPRHLLHASSVPMPTNYLCNQSTLVVMEAHNNTVAVESTSFKFWGAGNAELEIYFINDWSHHLYIIFMNMYEFVYCQHTWTAIIFQLICWVSHFPKWPYWSAKTAVGPLGRTSLYAPIWRTRTNFQSTVNLKTYDNGQGPKR
jgi:hypothetical protein